jgi:hypothetical protein
LYSRKPVFERIHDVHGDAERGGRIGRVDRGAGLEQCAAIGTVVGDGGCGSYFGWLYGHGGQHFRQRDGSDHSHACGRLHHCQRLVNRRCDDRLLFGGGFVDSRDPCGGKRDH